jgi:hypothetical protein
MNSSIIEAIDAEIEHLQQARAILTGTADAPSTGKTSGRGRPKGSKNAMKAAPVTTAKRTMSAEGRARIADAQKKRHAAKKRAAKKAATEIAG